MNPESSSATLTQEIFTTSSGHQSTDATDAREASQNEPGAASCVYRYANRHHCRLPVTPLSAPFCHRHASFRPKDPDSVNLAPALLGELTNLTTAVDMQSALSKLFILLAQNRITTKKASVLAYIIQQLMHTLPAVYYETHGYEDEDDQPITVIMPRRLQSEPSQS